MYTFTFFTTIFLNISVCFSTLQNSVQPKLEDLESNSTVIQEESSNTDLLQSLKTYAEGSIDKSWDYTEMPSKTTFLVTQEKGDIDLRNLKNPHMVQKQIKDDETYFKDSIVSSFAFRLPEYDARTDTSLMTEANEFSPQPLFPMTGPPNALIQLHTTNSNHSLTVDPYIKLDDVTTTYRSCIFCNNLEGAYCNDPRQSRLPKTITCRNKEDLCFSRHTPFGVVDRGCFNTRSNLSTYVCSCNLCNHIPITAMPYIFQTKKDWVKNVIELSHSKHLTKSVFKDMKCLRCEVNGTSESLVSDRDIQAENNCLALTNIELLDTEHCQEDQVCGVISKASEHYVWRGCLQTPLYNYWLRTCDKNLCNNDSIESVYT